MAWPVGLSLQQIVAEARQLPRTQSYELFDRLRAEMIDPRLGQRFYDSIDQRVREVCAQPRLYRFFDPLARRHFRRPFPLAISYLDRPDQVWILAVAPFKMKPGYWKERLR